MMHVMHDICAMYLHMLIVYACLMPTTSETNQNCKCIHVPDVYTLEPSDESLVEDTGRQAVILALPPTQKHITRLSAWLVKKLTQIQFILQCINFMKYSTNMNK